MLNVRTAQHRSTFAFFFIAFLPLAALVGRAPQQENPGNQEQTTFSVDVPPGRQAITKPVDIPEGALWVLRDTLSRGTLNCIKKVNGISPEQVPADWFVGSEIHLDGPDQTDLVIQPRNLQENPASNRCLFGANIEPFWVLRHISDRYELLLETEALGLQVLDTRTNAYRDIEASTCTAASCTNIAYKFYAAQYQIVEKRTKP